MCAGGETIRQLQVQCGAHIELHRGAQPNPNEKLFNIRGKKIAGLHAGGWGERERERERDLQFGAKCLGILQEIRRK
jgi:hypothetical protein